MNKTFQYIFAITIVLLLLLNIFVNIKNTNEVKSLSLAIMKEQLTGECSSQVVVPIYIEGIGKTQALVNKCKLNKEVVLRNTEKPLLKY